MKKRVLKQLQINKTAVAFNPDALAELRERIGNDEIIKSLEAKLKENGGELINWIQINGDVLHFDVLKRGPSYWYAVYLRNKQGETSKMTRICDYLKRNQR